MDPEENRTKGRNLEQFRICEQEEHNDNEKEEIIKRFPEIYKSKLILKLQRHVDTKRVHGKCMLTSGLRLLTWEQFHLMCSFGY